MFQVHLLLLMFWLENKYRIVATIPGSEFIYCCYCSKFRRGSRREVAAFCRQWTPQIMSVSRVTSLASHPSVTSNFLSFFKVFKKKQTNNPFFWVADCLNKTHFLVKIFKKPCTNIISYLNPYKK